MRIHGLTVWCGLQSCIVWSSNTHILSHFNITLSTVTETTTLHQLEQACDFCLNCRPFFISTLLLCLKGRTLEGDSFPFSWLSAFKTWEAASCSFSTRSHTHYIMLPGVWEPRFWWREESWADASNWVEAESFLKHSVQIIKKVKGQPCVSAARVFPPWRALNSDPCVRSV